jgi:hypothetical protein
MDRPNWQILLPMAAVGGFVLVGFWGLLVGPLGTAWFVHWRRERDGAEAAGDEDARLAVFMAEVAKAQMAASGRDPVAGAHTAAAPTQARIASVPSVLGAVGAPSAAPKPVFSELRQRIRQIEESALLEAFAAARLAELENAGDVHAAVEAALIARRAADRPEHAPVRLRAASRAISACLDGGHSALAAAIFGEYIADRTALRFAKAHWEVLGHALLSADALMEAAWALHAGAVLDNDLLGAQKRLVEVAAKAAAAGRTKVALKLYRTLLGKYPNSQYAEFVRSNMRVEEKKLAKGTASA